MKKSLLCLLILTSFASYCAPTVPKGFEILAEGVEERVDVVLAGKHVGLFDATVSLENVRFDNPEKVLAALELPVKADTADYQSILQALSKPLVRNGALACGSNGAQSGCGYLKTDGVAGIYDDSDSSMTLFFRDGWMPVDNQQSMYRAADTNSVENALVHQQDLNVLKQDDYSSLFLQGADALGITDNSYIGSNWSLTASKNDDDSDNNVDVSNLYYRYDIARRYYFQAGRMDNRTLFNTQGGNFSFSFLPLGAIDGARMGSTMSYLNPERAGQGTPVMVLLTRSSRIDAYRGNQLLGSFYLPAGNQSLDTSQFPDGSYTVTLRVYESNQLARTESTSFTKNGGMSDGRIHWFVQGGQISGEDSEAYQAGIRLPLLTMLSLTGGAAVADGIRSVEGGIDFSPDFGAAGRPTLSANLYHDDAGGRGDSEQLSWSVPDLPSLSLYRSSSRGQECNDDDDDDDLSYNQIGCYENMNASLTASFWGWNNVLSFIRTENHDDHSTWDDERSFSDNLGSQTTANAVSRTLQLSSSRAWSIGNWMLSSTLGAFTRNDQGYDDRDNGIYLSLSLYETPKPDEHFRSQSTRLSADYRDSKHGNSQTSYQVEHDWYWDDSAHKELTVQAGGINTDTLDTSVTGRYDGRYGDMSATLSDSYDNQSNEHTTAATGSWSTSFALSRQGLDWGGAGTSDPAAALLVKVDDVDGFEGDSAALVDARVSGNRPVALKTGSKALFPLSPYASSHVEIADSRMASEGATTAIVNGAGSSDVMLLPGKVRMKTITAEQRFGYIGTLELPGGARSNPVIGLNTRMLLLAEDGGFTAQLPGKAKMLYLTSGTHYYQCPLTVQKQRGVVRYVGKTLCQSITPEALPDSVNKDLLAKRRREQQNLQTSQNRNDE
jgi:hypothetical protein